MFSRGHLLTVTLLVTAKSAEHELCVCVILFSVIIIFNGVYISTFNYYVKLHFWQEVGGQGLFVLYWSECPLVVFCLQQLTCMHCAYLVL